MKFWLSFAATLLSHALLFLPQPSSAGRIFTEYLYPNFTASNFQFIDNSGVFFSSINNTFRAAISNPSSPSSSNKNNSDFYLYIFHVKTNTIIWSANRNSPISNSGQMKLTVNGIAVTFANGTLAWSTLPLKSPVTALRLMDTGNLVLLNRSNVSIWESFDHPTDTILMGQRFFVGTTLTSAVSDSDTFSSGDYRFSVTEQDAVLRWKGGQKYWVLSADVRAIKNDNGRVSYMEINATGLYLFEGNGSAVIWQVIFFSPTSDFRIATLDFGGRFLVKSFSSSSTEWENDFTAPTSNCQLPSVCGSLGLCTDDPSGFLCSCLPQFRSTDSPLTPCSPSDGSNLAINSTACNSNENAVGYIELDGTTHYSAANDLSSPTAISGVNISGCRDRCTKNCSCFGFFYQNSTTSCFLIENELGSVYITTTQGTDATFGYIKTIIGSSIPPVLGEADRDLTRDFPIVALVLLPCTGAFLLITLLILVFLCRRRRQTLLRTIVVKLGRPNSTLLESDLFLIPGLPVRFSYEELEAATDNFQTQIGSGGFGTVYKGTLPNKTLVAVKKISNIGVQGKKEFCTEIAVIGNIHHVNLVKLKGFCVQGQDRLLVYEYMNRGSLDRSLFGVGPVLEWQERVDIALGTARGLAYLHGGCEHKIIHCDVKPENILLHEQSQVKISDFGLSKLLSPEQSNSFTTMRGTRGYLAPEWLTNSAISDRTDVYSYGMVLLEIVRGRKNCLIQGQPPREESRSLNSSSSLPSSSALDSIYFPMLALDMHEQGRYMELADRRLEGRVTSDEVEKLVRVALCCVHEEPMLRPSMANVVAMLEGGIALGEPRLESLNFLRFYGRRFAEPSMPRGNRGNGLFFYPQVDASSSTTTASASSTSVSHLSSQQVSGPR